LDDIGFADEMKSTRVEYAGGTRRRFSEEVTSRYYESAFTGMKISLYSF
jgi:hypothetical protein